MSSYHPTVSTDALRILTQAVVDLTELRLRNCPHLVVENFAAEMFEKLLGAYTSAQKWEYRP